MENAKVRFQVIRFDRSTNEFDYLECEKTWKDAVNSTMHYINEDVDKYNDMDREHQCDYMKYHELDEIFENGQNYIINNHVYAIIDISIKDEQPEYEDVVIVIWGIEMDDRDLCGIKMPFESKQFFNGYMNRVVSVFGGSYEVHSLDSFDNLINQGRMDIGEEDRPYIVHTKIVK